MGITAVGDCQADDGRFQGSAPEFAVTELKGMIQEYGSYPVIVTTRASFMIQCFPVSADDTGF
jgi:hypothetical protein